MPYLLRLCGIDVCRAVAAAVVRVGARGLAKKSDVVVYRLNRVILVVEVGSGRTRAPEIATGNSRHAPLHTELHLLADFASNDRVEFGTMHADDFPARHAACVEL